VTEQILSILNKETEEQEHSPLIENMAATRTSEEYEKNSLLPAKLREGILGVG